MEVYGGSSRRKRTTAADLQRVKVSGQRADQIAQMRKSHHQEIEIPEAEKFLKESLETVKVSENRKNFSHTLIPVQKNIFLRFIYYIINFFQSFFSSPK